MYDLPCHGEVKTKMRYKNNSKVFIINIVMSGYGNVDGKRERERERERKKGQTSSLWRARAKKIVVVV